MKPDSVRLILIRFSFLYVALVIAGCGQTPANPRPHQNTVTDPGPDASPVMTVTLHGEPATEYRTDSGRASTTATARVINQRFPDLGVDSCLERAAAVYGRTSRADDLPLAFSEFVLHWAGCPDPYAAVAHVLTTSDGEEDLLEYLGSLKKLGATHVGAARQPASPPYRWRWTVFLTDRRFELQPVPTSAAAGSSLILVLRFLDAIETASVITTGPDGKVRQTEVGLSRDRMLASIELARRPGTQWIEVMASDTRGPRVVALFPVEIGREPPRAWRGAARSDEAWISDPSMAEGHALALLHQDRDRFALPRLVEDPTLAAIARRHSVEMAAGDEVAHFSPTTGTVGDRLDAAGYRAIFFAENIARSSTVADAQDGLMRSPGHRAAILGTTATHVGIGIVERQRPDTGKVYFLTQVFARPDTL